MVSGHANPVQRSVDQTRVLCAWFMSSLFLFAAAMKMIDSKDLLRSLSVIGEQLGLSGSGQSQAALVVVPLLVWTECVIGFLLLHTQTRRIALLSSSVLLMVFSLGLFVLLNAPVVPRCGCLGSAIESGLSPHMSIVAGIGRNLALLLLAVWLFFTSSPSSGVGNHSGVQSPVDDPLRARNDVASTRGGFTLIEVLVSLLILSLLLALVIGSLGLAREQARTLRELGSSRSMLQGLQMYVDGQHGWLPYMGVPGDLDAGVPALTQIVDGVSIPMSYFGGQSRGWLTALFQAGIDMRAISATRQIDSEEYGDHAVITFHLLTHAAAAMPRYWIRGEVPTDPSLIRGVQAALIRYPASKGLLLDATRISTDPRVPDGACVGMADGSAVTRNFRPYDEKLIMSDLHPRIGVSPWRVLTTEHGIYGRDF